VIIVSDTTAITSLLQISQIDLLRKLFGEVYIPPAVHRELMAYHQNLPDFIRISVTVRHDLLPFDKEQLDQGEIEAITLAKELNARYLIIDELIGRRIAEELGINCIGLVGVLILAKHSDLLNSLRETLDQLEETAGFYLHKAIKTKALLSTGEIPFEE
jgi:predicted nucleic acid-binding protein